MSAYSFLYREMSLSTLAGRVTLLGVGAVAAGLIVRHARSTPPRRRTWTPFTASLVAASVAAGVAFAFVAYDGWPWAVFFPRYFFPGPAIALCAAVITAIAAVARPATLGIGLIGSWTTVASSFLVYFAGISWTDDWSSDHPVSLAAFAIATTVLVVLLITHTVRTQRTIDQLAD